MENANGSREQESFGLMRLLTHRAYRTQIFDKKPSRETLGYEQNLPPNFDSTCEVRCLSFCLSGSQPLPLPPPILSRE